MTSYGSPHVAFSKATSSVADASPQKMCAGTERGESETKTKTNKTRVRLQRRGAGGKKTPKLHSDPGAASIAQARGSAVVAHLSTHCAVAAALVCLTCCLNSRSQVESVASRLSTQSLSEESQAQCRRDDLLCTPRRLQGASGKN